MSVIYLLVRYYFQYRDDPLLAMQLKDLPPTFGMLSGAFFIFDLEDNINTLLNTRFNKT